MQQLTLFTEVRAKSYRQIGNTRKWARDNPYKYYAMLARYKSKPRTRIISLLAYARRRAKATGREVDPQVRELLLMNPPQTCACCGHALDYSYSRGKQGSRPRNSRCPSLDRKDNREGYTVSNTKVVCWKCNCLKSNFTVEELEQLLAYMRS